MLCKSPTESSSCAYSWPPFICWSTDTQKTFTSPGRSAWFLRCGWGVEPTSVHLWYVSILGINLCYQIPPNHVHVWESYSDNIFGHIWMVQGWWDEKHLSNIFRKQQTIKNMDIDGSYHLNGKLSCILSLKMEISSSMWNGSDWKYRILPTSNS